MNEQFYPLISVIIPTRNRTEVLKRSVKSVLKQTYKNYEIIIIDDNSNCDYKNAIEEFHSDKIRYFRNSKNIGGSLSRNVGIKNAKGKYIAFLDDDDEFLPEKLQLQLSKFKNTEFNNLGFVYCLQKCVDDNEGIVLKFENVKVKGNALKDHLLKNIATTSTIFIRKRILEEINGFKNLPAGQENDLIFRILKRGYEVDYVDKVLVMHHEHEGERISKSNKKIEAIKEIFKEKEEYFYLLTISERKEIKQQYYRTLFRNYLLENKKLGAIKYLFMTVKSNLFNFKNFIDIIILIIGYSNFLKIKKILRGG